MDELQQVVKYVQRHIQLTQQEEDFLVSLLKVTRVKKKQFIVQPEFTCRYRSYVAQGAMRAYVVDNEGQDHTITFAIEDWWISDYNSYINQVPATFFVVAMEDTTLVQLDYNAEQLLMETYPVFERFFRIITQRSFAFLQKRIVCNLTKSAEERYNDFMDKYPAVAARVPQYTPASYLGFSTEFLSKIRNKRTKKLK